MTNPDPPPAADERLARRQAGSGVRTRQLALAEAVDLQADVSTRVRAIHLLIHEIFGVKRQAGLLPEHVVDTFVQLFLQGIQR